MTGLEIAIVIASIGMIVTPSIVIRELYKEDYTGSNSFFHVAHNFVFKMFLKIKAI